MLIHPYSSDWNSQITRDYLRNNEWAKAEKAGQDQKVYADLKENHVNGLIDRFYIFNT